MTLTPQEQAAIALLDEINGNQYNATTNPRGMGDPGYLFNFEPATSAIATVGTAVAREVGISVASANTATSAAGTAVAARDTAIAARDVAVAAAVSSDFPFATTAGTGSAYTVDLTPNAVIGDGFAIRLNFHTACANNPTLRFDGGTVYALVDGLNRTTGGAYRTLDAGDIFIGMNLVVMFDSVANQFVIVGGFPIYKLSRDLDMNGFDAVNVGNVVLTDQTTNLAVGYSTTSYDHGTITTSTPTTLTLNPALGNKQRLLTNNSALTLVAPSTDTTMELLVTHSTNGGSITLSGFTKKRGDFVFTIGSVFLCSISTHGAEKIIIITELEAV